MATDIVQCVFSQANTQAGEDLSTVTPQVGGGFHPGSFPTNGGLTFNSSDPLVMTKDGRVRAGSVGKDIFYYNDSTPTSADYSVRVKLKVLGTTNNDLVGPCVRTSSGQDTFYVAVLGNYTGLGQGIAFFKHVNGAPAPGGSGGTNFYQQVNGSTIVPILGTNPLVELSVSGNTLTAKYNGNVIGSIEDDDITTKGFGGVYFNSGTADDNSGIQMEEFYVNDPLVVPPPPPPPPSSTTNPQLTINPTTATVVLGSAQLPIVATRLNSAANLVAQITGQGTISSTYPVSGTAFYYNPPVSGTGTDVVRVIDTYDLLEATCTINYAPPPPGPITITVDSLSCGQSPGNWSGDSNREGQGYRKSWNNGAWRSYSWNTPEQAPTAKLLLSNVSSGSTISYFINGILVDNVSVPSDSSGISISGLITGDNYLCYFLRNSNQANRWNLTNSVTDQGLIVDATSTLLESPDPRPWIFLIGDSISEGILANNGVDDFLACYTFALLQGFDNQGYDVGVSACGGSGWIRPGDNTTDVPAYYPSAGEARWNKINTNTSLLDSIQHLSAFGQLSSEPALIFINYGTNECLTNSPTSLMQSAIVGALIALRAAAPSAKIVVAVPFGLYSTAIFPNGMLYVNAVKAAFTAYSTAYPGDNFTTLLDLGSKVSLALASPTYGASVHPNAAGHAYVAPLVMAGLTKALAIQAPETKYVTTSVPTLVDAYMTSTYVTVEVANFYFQNRLNTDPWDYANPTNQFKALAQATRAIDRLNFIGRKVNNTQPLQWPRITTVRQATGQFFVQTSTYKLIPNDIVIAVCELALALLDGVDPDLEDDLLSSQSDAYATVRVTSDATLAKDHIKAGIPSIEAWRHLLPWLNDPRSIHLRKG